MVVDVTTRIGVANSDDLQQHTAASGVDVQQANASSLMSKAPANAARAIAKLRSLQEEIRMFLSQKRPGALNTPAQFILGARSLEGKANAPCASDGAIGSCRPTYLFV
jgi:hypothetical protein